MSTGQVSTEARLTSCECIAFSRQECKDRFLALSKEYPPDCKMKISVRVRGEWLQVPCRNGKSTISLIRNSWHW